MKKLKKIFKICFCTILIGFVIFMMFVVFKYKKYIKFYEVLEELYASKNIKIEVIDYDRNEESKIYTERKFYLKENNVCYDCKYNDSDESKMFAKMTDKKLDDIIFLDEKNKTFSFMVVPYQFDLIEKSLFSIPFCFNIFYDYDYDFEWLWQNIIYKMECLDDFLTAKCKKINDNGKDVYVIESDRKSYSFDGDDYTYTKSRYYYDADTLILYKETKVNSENQEKLVAEYEIKIDTVTDSDVNIPDLSNYEQLYY